MNEVADVEDVTLWATMPSSDRSSNSSNVLIEKSTRANQAQYVCVIEGRIRYYLGSLYQSSILTPKMSELEQPWHSRHVS